MRRNKEQPGSEARILRQVWTRNKVAIVLSVVAGIVMSPIGTKFAFTRDHTNHKQTKSPEINTTNAQEHDGTRRNSRSQTGVQKEITH